MGVASTFGIEVGMPGFCGALTVPRHLTGNQAPWWGVRSPGWKTHAYVT